MSLSQKDAQLQAFQREHVDLMKKLTETQDALQSKEQALQLMEARYEQLQAELDELQADASARDEELQFLRNEKIVLEVALQAARAEKTQLGDGAERLGQDVLDSSDELVKLRQEVQVQATQVSVSTGSEVSRQTQGCQYFLLFNVPDRVPAAGECLAEETSTETEGAVQPAEGTPVKHKAPPTSQAPPTALNTAAPYRPLQVMVEAYRRDAASKEQLISELKATKKRLLSEVKELKEEVQRAEQGKRSAEVEQQRLLQEVQRVQQQMSSLEEHLQEVQSERDQLNTQLQVHTYTHTHTNSQSFSLINLLCQTR